MKRVRGGGTLGSFGSLIDEATKGLNIMGDPIPFGTIPDDHVWRILKRSCPTYALYDALYDERKGQPQPTKARTQSSWWRWLQEVPKIRNIFF